MTREEQEVNIFKGIIENLPKETKQLVGWLIVNINLIDQILDYPMSEMEIEQSVLKAQKEENHFLSFLYQYKRCKDQMK